MVTRILSELNRTDLSDAAVDAIRSAIEHYGAQSFSFNETATATIITSGLYSYALPADFKTDRSVYIDQTGQRYRLEKQPYEYFMSRFSDNCTGSPSSYTIYGDNVLFWPVPDQSYSYHLAYTHSLPELTLSGSPTSNAWTNEMEQLIRMRAQADLLENVIRGDEAVASAAVCRGREADAYMNLWERRVQVQTTRVRRRGCL